MNGAVFAEKWATMKMIAGSKTKEGRNALIVKDMDICRRIVGPRGRQILREKGEDALKGQRCVP